MYKNKTKCDFCRYWTGQSCMVTPNSFYCKEALAEYNQYLTTKSGSPPVKSLRKW